MGKDVLSIFIGATQLDAVGVQSSGAEEKGGGIYASGDLSIQSSKQSLFNSNTSKQGGGALYIEGNVDFKDLEEIRIKYNKSGTFETKKVTLSLPEAQTNKSSVTAASQSGPNTTPTPTPPVTAKGGGLYTEKNLSISYRLLQEYLCILFLFRFY